MSKNVMLLAVSAIFLLTSACQQAVKKPQTPFKPIKVKETKVVYVPKTVIPNWTFKQWKAVCYASDNCPAVAMAGMAMQANNYTTAKQAFDCISYGSIYKRMALKKMLSYSLGNADLLYEVAAYARPIDKRIARVAQKLEKRTRRRAR